VNDGWQTVPMAQLCSIKSGKSDTQDAVEGGPYAFFDRSRTIKRSSRYLFDCEALIIPGEGTEFLPRHFTGKFDLHQRAYALYGFSDRIDVKYLYYVLHYQRDYFPRVAVGATVKSLRLRHFEQLPVPLASLPEQRRIVATLDEAFAAVGTARANAEQNLRNAHEAFENFRESVFIRPRVNGHETALGALASFRNGINYTKGSRGERVKVVGVGEFQDHFWAPLDGLREVTVDGELHPSDALRRGDILVVRSNGNPQLVGRCVVAGDVAERITHSGFTIRIRLSGADVLPRYLCHFLKSTTSRKRLADGGTGMNIKSLNQTTLSRLSVPVPSLSEQEGVIGKLDSLDAETECLSSIYQRKLDALDALKQSLLHQAFTGAL